MDELGMMLTLASLSACTGWWFRRFELDIVIACVTKVVWLPHKVPSFEMLTEHIPVAIRLTTWWFGCQSYATRYASWLGSNEISIGEEGKWLK